VNALIKLAPLYDRTKARTATRDRILYEPRSLRLRSDTPVVVNHDTDRVVGHVRELVEQDDWVWARCVITDPPEWLEAHRTAASFRFIPFQRQRYKNLDRVLDALVCEVSVLSPSFQPAEAGAKVSLLYEPKPKPRPLSRGEREMAELRRRLAASPERPFESVLAEVRRKFYGLSIDELHAEYRRRGAITA
jgi:hypothetical protein